jgi:hypothetical protein
VRKQISKVIFNKKESKHFYLSFTYGPVVFKKSLIMSPPHTY